MSGDFSFPTRITIPHGAVTVKTTSNRGFNAQELSDRCVEKLISIGENVEPALREQALAYRTSIKQLIFNTCEQAQRSERTTVCAQLEEAGFSEAAAFIRRT